MLSATNTQTAVTVEEKAKRNSEIIAAESSGCSTFTSLAACFRLYKARRKNYQQIDVEAATDEQSQRVG